MEQAGMDRKEVQALCAWAAKLVMEQQGGSVSDK